MVHDGEKYVLMDRPVVNRLPKLTRQGNIDARSLLPLRPGTTGTTGTAGEGNLADFSILTNGTSTSRLLANTAPADLRVYRSRPAS